MANEIDLHTHTTASDGAYLPADLVQLALRRGLRILGITDHDSMQGIVAAQLAAQDTPLTILPGVEINTDRNGVEIHVLGYYFFGYENPELMATLGNLRENRLHRAEQIITRLNLLGMQLDYNRVLEIAGGGSVGRPHIAQALLERGFVNSINDAFDRYLASGKPGYVPPLRISPEDAVRLITRTGGIASLAHPVALGAAAGMRQMNLDQLLPQLKQVGLVGLETYYSGYNAEVVATLLDFCASYDLLPTGGSDFHGGAVLETSDLGAVPVPESVVENLRAAAEKLRPPA